MKNILLISFAFLFSACSIFEQKVDGKTAQEWKILYENQEIQTNEEELKNFVIDFLQIIKNIHNIRVHAYDFSKRNKKDNYSFFYSMAEEVLQARRKLENWSDTKDPLITKATKKLNYALEDVDISVSKMLDQLESSSEFSGLKMGYTTAKMNNGRQQIFDVAVLISENSKIIKKEERRLQIRDKAETISNSMLEFFRKSELFKDSENNSEDAKYTEEWLALILIQVSF